MQWIFYVIQQFNQDDELNKMHERKMGIGREDKEVEYEYIIYVIII